MPDLGLLLGAGALVLLASVLAVRLSVRIGLPSLLLYLGIGLLIGEGGVGLQFDNAELTTALGLSAIVLILAEGGLTTRWRSVRPVIGLGLVLSTFGVAVSIGVVGVGLHYLLDLEWRIALLWGAVLAATDAAAVFSVLRSTRVGRRVVGSLELESGINDAPVFIAVVLLSSDEPWTWTTLLLVPYELGAGAGIGAALGLGGGWLLRKVALPATGLYPIATVAVCVLAYSGGQLAHASGLLATYVAGVVLGNARLPHRSDTLSFAEGLGWLAQIGLFVLLGLYASPANLPGAVVPALVAAAVGLLLARPLSVMASALPFRVPWREQVFISWAGLRGAVPIVLALIPLSQGVEGARLLVDSLFVLVILLTFVQGGTLPWVGRVLGLSSPAQATEVVVDSAPLDELGADLLQVHVTEGSKLHGVYLSELRLPVGSTVSLVVRAGSGFTPSPTTRLREGDQLLVVATAAVRTRVEDRIRAVHRAGRLARWHGVSGDGG